MVHYVVTCHDNQRTARAHEVTQGSTSVAYIQERREKDGKVRSRVQVRSYRRRGRDFRL